MTVSMILCYCLKSGYRDMDYMVQWGTVVMVMVVIDRLTLTAKLTLGYVYCMTVII